MMKCKEIMVLSLLISAFSCSAFAHGVEGKVGAGGVVVAAHYDSGEPMSYAKVKIVAPKGQLFFQSGRTDRNGRFCFVPDLAGNWKVVIDDEMGHRLEVKVPVDEKLVLQEGWDNRGPQEVGTSTFGKAAMGVSIIFGLCGLFLWWKGTKRA